MKIKVPLSDGASVCMVSLGELAWEAVLVGSSLNVEMGGCCFGADGLWKG